jgi:hypothetical protein
MERSGAEVPREEIYLEEGHLEGGPRWMVYQMSMTMRKDGIRVEATDSTLVSLLSRQLTVRALVARFSLQRELVLEPASSEARVGDSTIEEKRRAMRKERGRSSRR